MYWLPRPDEDRTQALEMELFSDLGLPEREAPPSLDHLIAGALPPVPPPPKGPVFRGTSFFGELEQYIPA